MNDNCFWDSNLWLYLFYQTQREVDVNKSKVLKKMLVDNTKSSRLESEIHISVQVLNETVNVLLKKFNVPINITQRYIEEIKLLTIVHPLTEKTTDLALNLINKYAFSWYDSLIVSSAINAKCRYLYSEDLQHGLLVEEVLIIQNPFR